MTKKKVFTGGIVIAVLALMLFMAGISFAGNLEPSAAPAPTMKTLEQIYIKLVKICEKTTGCTYTAGDGVCDRTLGETCSNSVADCPCLATICGDGTCNGTETTASCAADCTSRFTVLTDSPYNGVVVRDNSTSLVWERSTDPTGRNWYDANTYCSNLTLGGKDDWYLPAKDELFSLVDTTQTNPSLPLGHPFQNVQSGYYWSSTIVADNPNFALDVDFINGNVLSNLRNIAPLYVRCVRGGQ
jgi:hypothetical protein